MNKREAKRAGGGAASVIESALAGGWNELDRLYGDDADKVRVELNILMVELERRGSGS